VRRQLIIIFICLGIALASGAQAVHDSLHDNASMIDLRLVKSGLIDARDVVIAPGRWNEVQWAVAFGVAGLTIGLVTQDLVVQQFAQSHQTAILDAVTKYGLEPWGSGLYTLPALGIMYGVSFAIHDKKARMTALKGVEAFAYAAIATQILKQVFHRERPNQEMRLIRLHGMAPLHPFPTLHFLRAILPLFSRLRPSSLRPIKKRSGYLCSAIRLHHSPLCPGSIIMNTGCRMS